MLKMFIEDYNNSSTPINDDDESTKTHSPSVYNSVRQNEPEQERYTEYQSVLSFPLIKKLKNEIEKDLQDFFRCYLRGLIPYYIKRMEKNVLDNLNDKNWYTVNTRLNDAEERLHNTEIDMESKVKESMNNLIINNEKLFSEIEYTTVMIDDMTKEIERLKNEIESVKKQIKCMKKNRRCYVPRKERNFHTEEDISYDKTL